MFERFHSRRETGEDAVRMLDIVTVAHDDIASRSSRRMDFYIVRHLFHNSVADAGLVVQWNAA